MSEQKVFEINNLQDLSQWVLKLWESRADRTIWLLEGPVGSGKTETVKALGKCLGWSEVASPSFAIHYAYVSKDGETIDHLDLYRVTSEEDLESTGFWDLFAQEKGLVIIEWADQINPRFLPKDWEKVKIAYQITSQSTRAISVQKLS